MNRKLKKLIRTPSLFFKDSKIFIFFQRSFLRKAKGSLKLQEVQEKQGNIKKREVKRPKNKEFNIYVNKEYLNNEILKNYFLNLLNEFDNLEVSIGKYRFPLETIIITTNDREICNCKFNLSNVDNYIEKTGILFISDESNNSKKIDLLIHRINVAHLKKNTDYFGLYTYYKDHPSRNEQAVIKYALQAGIYKKEIIDSAVQILQKNYFKMTPGDINLFFSKLVRVIGTDRRLENVANKIASSVKVEIVGEKFLMRLASFFLEAGDYQRSISMALKAKKKNSRIWDDYNFLALSYLLYSEGYDKSDNAKKQSELFLRLEKNGRSFLTYVKKNNINIIGNSPCELKLGKGGEIDSTNKILRFNSAIDYYPWSLDYGCKTDILVLNPRYYETVRNSKFNLDYIVVSDGNLYSTANLYYKIKDLERYASKVCLLPREYDIELTNKIEASPSSGLKILDLVYKCKGTISSENVFGFSFIDQCRGFSTSYSVSARGGLPTIHNWQNEYNFFNQIVN